MVFVVEMLTTDFLARLRELEYESTLFSPGFMRVMSLGASLKFIFAPKIQLQSASEKMVFLIFFLLK